MASNGRSSTACCFQFYLRLPVTMPSGAPDGVYQSVTVETFPATDQERAIEWQTRPYHNRGKIIIGGHIALCEVVMKHIFGLKEVVV
ncbi:uncharacterized protein LMH87_007617 [Akanthomyces muscarius]|uniref:Uncharacterized protein n=1 Tax=Akanthomyces muscarius TaxID=2231603 RepID=A0A9W8QL87_AKAMU|nr:uncharacterized protein LMH87_007617 [Akanthomyces muscarius]KAJ4161586.1 hypothetical protein LMH87_007617 [Akanthomyces muscarius]